MAEITIRDYSPDDAERVGRLIADTYSAYNLDFVSAEARGPFLGPFQYAYSDDQAHREAIANVIQSEMLFVAVDADENEIVGVLRGRKERLASLFVRGDRHRQGIGRRLVEHFERASREQGVGVIRVAATLKPSPRTCRKIVDIIEHMCYYLVTSTYVLSVGGAKWTFGKRWICWARRRNSTSVQGVART